MLAYVFSFAATDPGQVKFALFWLGVFLFTVPAFLRLCTVHAPRPERLAIVAAVGLMDFLPKILRSPPFPLFHDEHAHMQQVKEIAAGGHPFVPNSIVQMSEFFPGLHTLTVALQQLTGLGDFQLHVVLMALLHVVALLGVFVLAETIFESARVGGLAAFIFSLNPGFMWFDSQYAYESLAIVFFIWAIVAFLRLEVAGSSSVRVGWFAVGMTLAGACVVTHHLSSYSLAATLLLAQGVILLRARARPAARRAARVTGAFTLGVALMTAAWSALVAPETLDYLVRPLQSSIHELGRLLDRQQEARALFTGSTAPTYERMCAFLSPVIVGAGVLIGLYLLRRRSQTPGLVALAVLGLGFFASLPLMLTNLGVEAAVRTWSFSYLGLAVLLAPVVPWIVSRGGSQIARRAVLAGVTLAVIVVLIGNVTMRMNVDYRFPGAFVYGSDTRSLTPELVTTARWFRGTYGGDQRIVSDRYTGLAFGSFGRAWWAYPTQAFPAWDLLLKEERPSRRLLRQLRDQHYRYLVVDERMARDIPLSGAYFTPGDGEPGANPVLRPVPAAALTKFEHLPFANKVYETDNLSIYRFDYGPLRLGRSRRG